MKIILFVLLISFSLCIYEPDKAIKYAKNYCDTYNKPYSSDNFEPSNFISQCLDYGGQRFDSCANKNSNNIIKGANNLIKCLKIHKWTELDTSSNIQPGWIIRQKNGSFLGIITEVSGTSVKYCAHESEEGKFVCDKQLSSLTINLIYYSPPDY